MRKADDQKGTVKTCGWCAAAFRTKDRTQKFCCKPCSYAWRRKNGARGESHPQWKAKVECVCPICLKLFYQFPSRAAATRGARANYCSNICRIAALQRMSSRRTGIEIRVAAMLSDADASFEEQVPMYDRWVVDFILHDFNMVVFADGTYWHGTAKTKSKDRGQTVYLEKCGYRVVRLGEHQINDDLNDCWTTIVDALA